MLKQGVKDLNMYVLILYSAWNIYSVQMQINSLYNICRYLDSNFTRSPIKSTREVNNTLPSYEVYLYNRNYTSEITTFSLDRIYFAS